MTPNPPEGQAESFDVKSELFLPTQPTGPEKGEKMRERWWVQRYSMHEDYPDCLRGAVGITPTNPDEWAEVIPVSVLGIIKDDLAIIERAAARISSALAHFEDSE